MESSAPIPKPPSGSPTRPAPPRPVKTDHEDDEKKRNTQFRSLETLARARKQREGSDEPEVASPTTAIEERAEKSSSLLATSSKVSLDNNTTFTSHNMGVRKNRVSAGPNALLGSSSSFTLDKSPTVKSTKSFKEYFSNFVSDLEKRRKPLNEAGFGADVAISDIFGSKTDEDAVEQMLWASRTYESIKGLPPWSKKPEAKPLPPPKEDMALRIVDIVSEGRLETLSYIEAESGLDLISQGPTKSLLDALIFPLEQDMSYPEVFFASYRFFLPAQDVLDAIIGWYNADSEEDDYPGSEAFLRKNRKHIQARAIRVLLVWIGNHWPDFQDDKSLYEDLKGFVDYLAKVSFGNNQKLAQAIRDQRLTWYTHEYIPMFPISKSIENHASPLEWEEIDFAHNLTMIDHIYFRQLRPDMYIQLLHTPGKVEGGVFNVPLKMMLDYTAWFRLIVIYTASIVVKEEGSKKKSAILKRCLKIARICRDLGNFNTVFAIMHGLKQPIVLMWTHAFENLSTKYMDLFRELEALTDPANSFSKYWTMIKMHEPPVPYMTELVDIHSDGPVVEEDEPGVEKRIDFQKYYDLYSVAAELETFRLSNYKTLLKGDRDSNMHLLTHMRAHATLDDKVLGEGLSGNDVPVHKGGIKRFTQLINFGKDMPVIGSDLARSNSVTNRDK